MSEEKATGRIFTDRNMAQSDIRPFAGGTAVVYSARRPDAAGENEDAAGLLPVDSERGVLVVADGMGGQPGGASASQIALRCLKKSVEEQSGANGPIRAAILDGVENANRAVLDLGIGAATTFAALEVAGDSLRPYHVGDSSILITGQRGKLKLRTVAHSPVGYAVESGMLDEHEAMHHDERHLISNMIGSTDMRIEVGSPYRLAPHDTALLATDGVLDNLDVQEVIEIVRSGPLEEVSRDLARHCHERMRNADNGHPSKPDDFTFVLFRGSRRTG